MRRTHLATLVALAAVAVPVAAATSSASAAVTPAWTTYFLAGGTTNVSGLKVSGYEGKRVYVSVKTDAPGATLKVGSTGNTDPPFGYTYSNAYSGSSVQFVGDQDQVNAALASLAVTLPADTRKASLITTAFESRADLAYNPQNQHFYKYVAGKITGSAAQTAASTGTEMGLNGYLASITSEEENNFVAGKIQGDAGSVAQNVWIGASDSDTEGDWKWVGGPDNGVQFWKGCNVANGGGPYEGRFSAWAPGEPNNWNASLCQVENSPVLGEDCAIINKYSPTSTPPDNAFFEKQWNDLPCSYGLGANEIVKGYVAEYGNRAEGGDFSNLDLVASTLNVAVPATQPTWLDTLFQTIFGPRKTAIKAKKVSKAQQKKAAKKKAKQTRLSYDLVFRNGGRFSFYLTNKQNKVITINEGSSIAGRKLTKPMSVPVIRDIKAGATVQVRLDGDTKKLAKGALLNVILQEKMPDGTFKLYRQDAPDPPLVKVN